MLLSAHEQEPILASFSHAGPDAPVLSLSGGAMKGAFGAGFLNGWAAASPDQVLPRFQVVCGISTGALLAPFALLGSAEDLNRVGTAYRSVGHRDLFAKRCTLAALLSTSLATADGLESLIDQYITDDILRRLAAEYTAGQNRVVLIGTVNLNSGKFVPWNISELAVQNEFQLVRHIIFASCVSPALLPPVCIGGEPHVDGGTRRQVFFDDPRIKAMFEVARPQVYAIINGTLGGTLSGQEEWSFFDIAVRGVDILSMEAMIGNLYKMAWQADSRKADLLFTYIEASELCCYPDSYEYEKQDMERLYQYGYQRGFSGQAWASGIEALMKLSEDQNP